MSYINEQLLTTVLILDPKDLTNDIDNTILYKLKGNIEGNATKSREIQFICNDNVTVGKRYDRLFSANPMKILWLGDRTYQQTYGGTGGMGFGAQTFGATSTGS